ncbi:MAG: helix-turn-helix domain-containing protein [Thermoplasmata archaeon]|nr:helix-turn-helix domain-containing protein [Thermoplasmata archaeon]
MDATPKIPEIAERIRALRDLCGYTQEEMAAATGVSAEEYANLETGTEDFGFTFLYKCAEKLGVDIIEIITGSNPRLSDFTMVRSGEGLPIKRREGFTYYHLAPTFKDKISEPFLVYAPFIAEEQDREIALSRHVGQEFDYIISGSLRFSHEGRTVDVGPGDSLYYDSGKGHGMIATSREGCTFLAIVMRKGDGE